MTPRLAGGIAVGMLAVGILTGAARAIVVRDATSQDTSFAAVMADHMNGVGAASMMSGSMMGAWLGMMTGPGASSMPGNLHDQHHPAASPDGAE